MNKKFISAILAALIIVSMPAVAVSADEVEQETSGVKGTIKFDPGDWNSNKINFYIWDDTTGLKASKDGWIDDNTWGAKKKIGGTKLDDGTFESYEFDITPGNSVYVIFHDPDKGQTFDCVLTETAFGDTAERTGEILENPVDSDQKAEAVKFKNSGLTSKLCITSTGKIQGETIPASMDPAKEVATFIFKYQGTQDKNTKTDVVTPEVLREAVQKFGTTAVNVFAAYKALEGTDIATKDGGENGGYTSAKEAEAQALLGIKSGSTNTTSTVSVVSSVIKPTSSNVNSAKSSPSNTSSVKSESVDGVAKVGDKTVSFSWSPYSDFDADDMSVMFDYQPTDKNATQEWNIYSIGRMDLQDYTPFKKGGKWGLVSASTGKVEVEPQFDGFALGFGRTLVGLNSDINDSKVLTFKGSSWVQTPYDPNILGTNGKAGVFYWVTPSNALYKVEGPGSISKSTEKGTMVVDQGHFYGEFNDIVPDMRTDGTGSIKLLVSNGNAIKTGVNQITGFGNYSDGIIPLRNADGKWGYVDANGRTVIPFEYDAAWKNASDSLVRNSGGQMDWAYDASNGYVVLSKGSSYWLYTTDGQPVIGSSVFDEILPVYYNGHEKLAWAKKNGQWGVIHLNDSGSGTTGGITSSDTSSNNSSTPSSPVTGNNAAKVPFLFASVAALTGAAFALSSKRKIRK